MEKQFKIGPKITKITKYLTRCSICRRHLHARKISQETAYMQYAPIVRSIIYITSTDVSVVDMRNNVWYIGQCDSGYTARSTFVSFTRKPTNVFNSKQLKLKCAKNHQAIAKICLFGRNRNGFEWYMAEKLPVWVNVQFHQSKNGNFNWTEWICARHKRVWKMKWNMSMIWWDFKIGRIVLIRAYFGEHPTLGFNETKNKICEKITLNLRCIKYEAVYIS